MMILSKTPVVSAQSPALARSFNSTDPSVTQNKPVIVAVGTVHVPQLFVEQAAGEMGSPLTKISRSPPVATGVNTVSAGGLKLFNLSEPAVQSEMSLSLKSSVKTI